MVSLRFFWLLFINIYLKRRLHQAKCSFVYWISVSTATILRQHPKKWWWPWYMIYLTDNFSNVGTSVSKIIAGNNLDIQTNAFGNSIVGRDVPTASNNSTTISNSTNSTATISPNIILPTGGSGLFKLNTDINAVTNNNILHQHTSTSFKPIFQQTW